MSEPPPDPLEVVVVVRAGAWVVGACPLVVVVPHPEVVDGDPPFDVVVDVVADGAVVLVVEADGVVDVEPGHAVVVVVVPDRAVVVGVGPPPVVVVVAPTSPPGAPDPM